MADLQKYTSPVPTDYQEVEYIQSTGNGEYIDTGYIPTVNTRFNIDFQFIEATSPYYESIPIMGERVGTTSASNSKFALWINKTSYKEAINFGTYDSGYDTSDITNANVRNVTSNIRANMYYNGIFVRGDNTAEFTTGELSIYLFALNSSGTPDNRNCVVKLYRYKLYENDVLVRDFVPVYRKSDNVAGLYDTINDVFYINQGTGSFTVGANISPWLHSLRKLGTETETLTLPQTIYADGTAATVSLKGNTVQNGTPTPSNPVEVNGVGERTENKFDTFISGIAIDTITGAEVPSSSGFTSDFIAVDDNSFYSYSGGNNTISTCFFAYDSAKAYIGRSINVPVSATIIQTVTYVAGGYTVFASSLTGNTNPIAYIRVGHLNGTQAAVDSETIMLNTGSTAKPYEPYGYKIPILMGTTNNVYLGEVQTTRNISKYEFTGQESNININLLYSRFEVFLPNAKSNGVRLTPAFCSHYQVIDDGRAVGDVPNECLYSDVENSTRWFIKTTDYTTIPDFKAYLAQQYANGTPVTVWYILATETTGIVNEPLMKIDSYSDSLTTSIPCTAGANTFDVDTTVQPSEVSATYTGWHDAEVKEKSENLFDSSKEFKNTYISIYNNTGTSTVTNTSDYIKINSSTLVLSGVRTTDLQNTSDRACCFYTANKTLIDGVLNPADISTPCVIAVPQNTAYIRFAYDKSFEGAVMVNEGSTALPYEPYWK